MIRSGMQVEFLSKVCKLAFVSSRGVSTPLEPSTSPQSLPDSAGLSLSIITDQRTKKTWPKCSLLASFIPYSLRLRPQDRPSLSASATRGSRHSFPTHSSRSRRVLGRPCSPRALGRSRHYRPQRTAKPTLSQLPLTHFAKTISLPSFAGLLCLLSTLSPFPRINSQQQRPVLFQLASTLTSLRAPGCLVLVFFSHWRVIASLFFPSFPLFPSLALPQHRNSTSPPTRDSGFHTARNTTMDTARRAMDKNDASNGATTRKPSTRVKNVVDYDEKRHLVELTEEVDVKKPVANSGLSELEERVNDLSESWETESLFQDALEDLAEDRFFTDG